jgi:hypothetical protein
LADQYRPVRRQEKRLAALVDGLLEVAKYIPVQEVYQQRSAYKDREVWYKRKREKEKRKKLGR